MARIIVGHFEPDGALIYLPIGFVPARFLLIEYGITNPKFYWWFERMQDDEATGSQEGILDSGGTKTKLSDAGGIAAYDTGTEGPTVTQWSIGATATARTLTAHGTYFKATTSGVDSNGREIDRSAIFECVTGGTTNATTEPVWPTVVGENGPSDNGVVWQKVDVALKRLGYKGVRIAAALMTDGQEMYFEAVEADLNLDLGDVVGWTSGIQGN